MVGAEVEEEAVVELMQPEFPASRILQLAVAVDVVEDMVGDAGIGDISLQLRPAMSLNRIKW